MSKWWEVTRNSLNSKFWACPNLGVLVLRRASDRSACLLHCPSGNLPVIINQLLVVLTKQHMLSLYPTLLVWPLVLSTARQVRDTFCEEFSSLVYWLLTDSEYSCYLFSPAQSTWYAEHGMADGESGDEPHLRQLVKGLAGSRAMMSSLTQALIPSLMEQLKSEEGLNEVATPCIKPYLLQVEKGQNCAVCTN